MGNMYIRDQYHIVEVELDIDAWSDYRYSGKYEKPSKRGYPLAYDGNCVYEVLELDKCKYDKRLETFIVDDVVDCVKKLMDWCFDESKVPQGYVIDEVYGKTLEIDNNLVLRYCNDISINEDGTIVLHYNDENKMLTPKDWRDTRDERRKHHGKLIHEAYKNQRNKRYELCRSECFAYPSEIKNGICQKLLEPDEVIEPIASFNELSKYKSYTNENYKQGNKIYVCEYFLTENTINEDGEVIDSRVIKYADGLENINKKGELNNETYKRRSN